MKKYEADASDVREKFAKRITGPRRSTKTRKQVRKVARMRVRGSGRY